MVSKLEVQSIEKAGIQICTRAEIWVDISAPPAPASLEKSIMTTLTIHCQWEDYTARKMAGHLP